MFVPKRQIIYILAILTFLSSCITSEKVNYMQKPGFNIPAYKDSTGFGDYRLRAGDRLFVKVYSTDDKTNAFPKAQTEVARANDQKGKCNTYKQK